MTKAHTTAALASKQIKAELKKHFPDTKFSVTSANYGCGGSSVQIIWNGLPLRDKVHDIADKHQEGTWNGLTDCYDYTNIRKDIPQVMFVQLMRREQDGGRIARY